MWQAPNSRTPTRPAVRHPVKVMVWGMFYYYDTGRLHVCEGNMNKERYLGVLRTCMKPQLDDWFGEDDCIFMQDRAPCHTAKIVSAYLRELNIRVLDWPGNSPDLNPIENLWAILKNRLKKHTITTKQQLIEKVLHYWSRDPKIPQSLANLIESMPRRMEAVISAKGGNTKY